MSIPRPTYLNRLRPAALLLLALLGPLGPAIGQAVPARAVEAPVLTAPNPGPGDTDPALYAALLPVRQQDIYAETAGRLSRYRVEATLTPAGPAGAQPATIAGTLDLNWYNETGEAQSTLYFRLYPNVEEYDDGALTLDRVEIDGQVIPVTLSEADTVAAIDLPVSAAPETTVEVTIDFTTTIPTNPPGTYGMFRQETNSGSYALAHWQPLLAGYDPVRGWNLEPSSVFGDPVFTNAALWEVALTAPSELVIVTTGSETGQEPAGAGLTRHTFVSGPVRDFVMAADADFQSDSVEVGGTTITSWYNPDETEGGQEVMLYGMQSLEFFNRSFGAYPYAEMDLVEIRLGGGAAGVEFPQLMFIGGNHYGANSFTREVPGFLEFLVVHEVAHQWWYGLVGNNQYYDAYIDEGLTNYVSILYFASQYGADAGEQQLNLNLKLPYFNMLFGDRDQIAATATDAFASQDAYATTIYGKAALGFDAVYQAIGAEAFYAALHAYVTDFSFEVANPANLREAFERASGEDLTELWRHWFEAAEGREDYDAADLARLLRELGQ